MAGKIKVGILGATGMVGQRFVELLNGHPWFEVAALGASPRSAGQPYKVAAKNWRQQSSIPEDTGNIVVTLCEPEHFLKADCRLVFSGLDSSVAGEIETNMANSGLAVFSNSKNHRMDDLVPLVVPSVNSSHLEAILEQQAQNIYNNKTGFIVTNANCSSTGLCIPLKALDDAFGLDSLFVTTMQAVSGAGYPGCAAIDMIDNIVPYISGEEPKLEIEPQKILGTWSDKKFNFHSMKISAHCNRVPVTDGHSECVNIKLKKKATVEEVKVCLENYRCEAETLGIPSALNNQSRIVVKEENDRPQPRLDRQVGKGFGVVVGRIRECSILDFKFIVLSHNTIIGAAGGALMNAELCKIKNLL